MSSSLVITLLFTVVVTISNGLPNIIFFLVDDLGWNDISIHNGSDFKTPNIDKLATNGLLLDNYYIQFLCSPTRTALMSGRYPIHIGCQHGVITATDTYGLPLENTLLPQDLKKAGYNTHMLGKWDCGFCNEAYVPDKRGFDTFFGYYSAFEDYFNHNKSSQGGDKGYDFRNNSEKISYIGQYSTWLYGNVTMDILKNYNTNNNEKPFFIYFASQAVHGPLQAPQYIIDSFNKTISNLDRRTYAAMVTVLDDVIGQIVDVLKNELNIWHNTLIILSTDNGGASWKGGNNYPLRGSKANLFEGGVKGVGIVSGGYLRNSRMGQSTKEMIHITDWYPTICDAAGITPTNMSNLDGYNMLNVIQNKSTISERTEILLNIDPMGCNFTETPICGGIIMNEWKLIIGKSAMSNKTCYEGSTTVWCPLNNTNEYYTTIKCNGIEPIINETFYSVAPYNGKPCLYNLQDDPCEYKNVINDNPDIYQKLYQRLLYYNSTMVPPLPLTHKKDPTGANPDQFGGWWSPWLNYTN